MIIFFEIRRLLILQGKNCVFHCFRSRLNDFGVGIVITLLEIKKIGKEKI